MNRDEIVTAMDSLVAGAETRSLSTDEVSQYEKLETELKAVNETEQIRSRQSAYKVAAPAVHFTAGGKPEDSLERAFESYLRTGVANADMAELRSQTAGSTTAGGYSVPTQTLGRLTEIRKAFGGVMNLAENITTSGGNPINFPTLDDTANAGHLTAEGSADAGSADFVLGQVALSAYKYTSAGSSNSPLKVSVELLQDSALDIHSLVTRKLGERIARKQALDLLTGTGSSQPKGLCFSGITLDVEQAGGSNTNPTLADILAIYGALDPAYEEGAKWIMNKASMLKLMGINDSTGRPLLFGVTSPATSKLEWNLYGFPVVVDQGMPSDPATLSGIPYILFGNFEEAYVVRHVADVQVFANPYSSISSGLVEYSAIARMDAQIKARKAYVAFGNAA